MCHGGGGGGGGVAGHHGGVTGEGGEGVTVEDGDGVGGVVTYESSVVIVVASDLSGVS